MSAARVHGLWRWQPSRPRWWQFATAAGVRCRGLLLVVSSGYFAIAGVHIYWPRGVLTMLVMALAFGWVALTVLIRVGSAADRRAESQRSGRRRMTGPMVGFTRLAAFDSHARFDLSQVNPIRRDGQPAR